MSGQVEETSAIVMIVVVVGVVAKDGTKLCCNHSASIGQLPPVPTPSNRLNSSNEIVDEVSETIPA